MSDLETNIEKLNGFLAPIRERGILNQIGGEAVPALSGETFESHSPVDESDLQCGEGRRGGH